MNRVFTDDCRDIALRRQCDRSGVWVCVFLLGRDIFVGGSRKGVRRRRGCVIGRLTEKSDWDARRAVAFLEHLGDIGWERINNSGCRSRHPTLRGSGIDGRGGRFFALYGRRRTDGGAVGRPAFSDGLVCWRLRKRRVVWHGSRFSDANTNQT